MSEVTEVIKVTAKIDKPRKDNQVIADILRKSAIQTALGNVSNDVMDIEELDKETQKAIAIMEDAIYSIMFNCDIYGDNAILEENTLSMSINPKYSCHSFMEAVVNTAVENVDTRINQSQI